MDFQLQQIHSCEIVSKGVSITRMGTGKNCSEHIHNNAVLISQLYLQDIPNCTPSLDNFYII